VASVRKVSINGREVWLVRWRDPANMQRKKQFARKVDADKHATAVQHALLSGAYVDLNDPTTLAEYYAQWAPRQVHWARGTRAAHDHSIGTAPFRGTPHAKLRPTDIEAWVAEMAHRPLAPRTVHLRVANVRTVLFAAQRDRLLATNPCVGIKLPRVPRQEATMVLPAGAQVGAVLEAAPVAFAPFIACCAFAGLRLGEVAGLRVDDIDWLHRSLMIRRQALRTSAGRVEITPPKHGSERTVPVPDSLLAVLSAHMSTHGIERGSDRFLFDMLRASGQPPDDNTANHLWRRTCAAAGVARFRLHDLRHYYASGLIYAGCDVVTVQRALGHHSASVTLRNYSHLWPDAANRTRAAAAGLMSAVAGEGSVRAEAHS
jgi:integrase